MNINDIELRIEGPIVSRNLGIILIDLNSMSKIHDRLNLKADAEMIGLHGNNLARFYFNTLLYY